MNEFGYRPPEARESELVIAERLFELAEKVGDMVALNKTITGMDEGNRVSLGGEISNVVFSEACSIFGISDRAARYAISGGMEEPDMDQGGGPTK